MLMMLPFEAPTVFEGIHKSYFRMPRVVRDQRQRFENDDLFRQLSHESAVKYTGFKDRPLEERQMKFITNCQEGHTEVSVVQSGNQFTLMFNPHANPATLNEGIDFDKEFGKVHIKAGFILNGVCVLWRGWIDLQRLEGFGCLEFDEYRAYLEDTMAKQQIEKQQLCNNNTNSNGNSNASLQAMQPPPPPPIRLNHQPIGPAPPPMDHAAAAAAAVAAVTTNSMLPGAPPQLGLSGPPPPVSMAAGGDSTNAAAAAAHYGQAAIAAAAAAAFHQALQANGQHGAAGGPANGAPLHPLQAQQYGGNAGATLAQMGLQHAGSMQPNSHLPYTQISATRASTPPNSQHQHQQHIQRKSPTEQRENNNHKNESKRQAIKRQHEHEDSAQQIPTSEQMTQLVDEQTASEHLVDVVSDISAHDLDFPTRRPYKSANNETLHHHHHHHHHHPPHHKISRRAA